MRAAAANGGVGDPAGPCARQHLDAAPGKTRPGGPGNYWEGDFRYETWKAGVEDDFIVLPQIESRAGLERLDKIAAHQITTAMAIGPYDLSMELGVGAQMDHPKRGRLRRPLSAIAQCPSQYRDDDADAC